MHATSATHIKHGAYVRMFIPLRRRLKLAVATLACTHVDKQSSARCKASSTALIGIHFQLRHVCHVV